MSVKGLPPVDLAYQLPPAVRDRLATNLTDTATVEGAALADSYVRPRAASTSGPLAAAPAINVKDFGAVGDFSADDTAAIRAAAAAGNHLYFPPGNYKVSSVADGTALLTFTGQNGVIIDAREATITNPTSYTSDLITPMFLLDGCTNVRIDLHEYVGYTLPTPQTHLGYRGATLVDAVNGTNGVTVNAKITNARYGVHSGAYATPSAGGCRNFDIRIRSSFCGYSIALYLADGIRFDVDADDIHRAAYFAGCDDVRGIARWKNIYIAPTAVLITDALTAGTDAAAQIDPVGTPTSSKGCSNVDITSIDKGSAVFGTECYCIGISLSRADPMTYRNINMRFSATGTDTLSTTIHGFIINSAAKTTWSRYAFAWEPVVVLENVKVSGVLDKSATTVSPGAQGPFTVRVYESTASHAGTVRGLSIEDVIVKQGSVTYPAALLLARGVATPVSLRRVTLPSSLQVDTSSTVPTVIDASSLSTVDVSPLSGGSRLSIVGGSSVASINGTTSRTEVQGATIRSGGPIIKMVELVATLTGASVTLTGAIPTGCILLAVQGRVATAIAGATGYQIGVTGDLTRFVNTNTLTVGGTFGPASGTDASVRYYQANTDLIITAKTSSFTAGVLRVMVSYIEFPALTS